MNNRVAFFLPSLRGGGAERVMLTLASGFAEKGVAVDMVLAQAVGPLLSQVPPTINVINLGRNRVIQCVPALATYLRRQRPKAMLSAMGHANFSAILAKVLARSHTRLAVSLHGIAGHVADDDGQAKRAALEWLLKRVQNHADVIIAVSQGVSDDYIARMHPEEGSVRVIYNPAVRPDLFVKAAEPPCHEWLTTKVSPVVLAVGRLTRAKDYPTLIQAFQMVHRETGARLIILGEGEERASLEALVRTEGLEKCVSLPGFVENPYSFMKRADVFAFSSRWESFGLVLAEAMALGTPVVSTDCPTGPAEILEGGKWGQLVPVGDPHSLAQALVYAIQSPVRDAAVERAAAFSVDAILSEYADALCVTF